MKTEVTFARLALNGDGKEVIHTSIIGELDDNTNDLVFQQIHEYFQQAENYYGVLMDLSQLAFLNSKSIGLLIDFYKKMKASDQKMVLVNVSDNALDILELIGVTRVVETADTIEEGKLAILDFLQS